MKGTLLELHDLWLMLDLSAIDCGQMIGPSKVGISTI
jgi:hypothetical protein